MLTGGHLHISITNFFHDFAAIFIPVGCSKATSLHCFQNNYINYIEKSIALTG